MPSFVDSPDTLEFDWNHLFLKGQSHINVILVSAQLESRPVRVHSAVAAHRISIERLEVEAFIRYADVAWIGHQRHDHLHGTLHVRLLSDTMKALNRNPTVVLFSSILLRQQ